MRATQLSASNEFWNPWSENIEKQRLQVTVPETVIMLVLRADPAWKLSLLCIWLLTMKMLNFALLSMYEHRFVF